MKFIVVVGMPLYQNWKEMDVGSNNQPLNREKILAHAKYNDVIGQNVWIFRGNTNWEFVGKKQFYDTKKEAKEAADKHKKLNKLWWFCVKEAPENGK